MALHTREDCERDSSKKFDKLLSLADKLLNNFITTLLSDKLDSNEKVAFLMLRLQDEGFYRNNIFVDEKELEDALSRLVKKGLIENK